MSKHNSDIIRYLLFKLRDDGLEDQSTDYQDLLVGLKREVQSSPAIDLRPSTRSSWLRVKEYLDDEDVILFVKSFVELELLGITRLDLSHNKVGDKSAVALAESIHVVYFPTLTYLDLSHTGLGEDGVIALAEVLERGYLSGLTWLDLSETLCTGTDTKNGEEKSNALARALKSGNLLNLYHLGLPPSNPNTVVNAIWEGRLSTLNYLYLSGDSSNAAHVRLASIRELLEIIKHTPLEYLHLRRCGLTWDVMEDFTRALASRNDSHEHLRHLDLSENNLGVRGIVALGRAIKEGHLVSLTHLSLGSCGIEEMYQLRALEEGIRSKNLSKLEHLDLSSNKLGFLGNYSLVSMVEEGSLSNLLHLNLSNCNLSMMTALETLRPGKLLRGRSYLEIYERDVLDFIASMTKGHLSGLSILDLSFNKLSTQGCTALAGIIQEGALPNLHQLHMCGCGIKDGGILSLVDAVRAGQLHTLHYLDLGFNKFDDPGVDAIAGALKEGHLPNLRFLNLYLLRMGGVPFTKDAVASTHESIYSAAGLGARSLSRDTDVLMRISIFWAQRKRQDRLVRREAILPQMADSMVDAFCRNNKLTTIVVGLGEYDSLFQKYRERNMQVRMHNHSSNTGRWFPANILQGIGIIVVAVWYFYVVLFAGAALG